jgi:hypothetical protein
LSAAFEARLIASVDGRVMPVLCMNKDCGCGEGGLLLFLSTLGVASSQFALICFPIPNMIQLSFRPLSSMIDPDSCEEEEASAKRRNPGIGLGLSLNRWLELNFSLSGADSIHLVHLAQKS